MYIHKGGESRGISHIYCLVYCWFLLAVIFYKWEMSIWAMSKGTSSDFTSSDPPCRWHHATQTWLRGDGKHFVCPGRTHMCQGQGCEPLSFSAQSHEWNLIYPVEWTGQNISIVSSDPKKAASPLQAWGCSCGPRLCLPPADPFPGWADLLNRTRRSNGKSFLGEVKKAVHVYCMCLLLLT